MSARSLGSGAVTVLHALAGALCAAIACLLLWSASALAAGPPTVGEESVVGVSSDGATLLAQVNPEGVETTYCFEYGASAAYGSSAPAPAGVVGSGTSAVGVQAHVQSLALATTYHFRVVAVSADGTTDGPDETFTTQPAGGELTLPDDRQWEMVSPPVKGGARLIPSQETGVVQAAADGGAITYLSFFSATEPEPAGFILRAQIFSVRGAGGDWSSQDIDVPHEAGDFGPQLTDGGEYRFFSPDLALSIVEPYCEHPTLSSKAGERTSYIRDDPPRLPEASETPIYKQAEEEAPPDSHVGYLPLVTPANLPPGTKFGGPFDNGGVSFEGATPNMSRVLLTSGAALTSKATENGLYEWSGGALGLVSVLPGAGEAPVAGYLGSRQGRVARNAISADGSRVFWTSDAGHLYMRDTSARVTVQIDAAQGIPEPASGCSAFQLASRDGSRVYFTDNERLTPDSTAGGGCDTQEKHDLYECEVVETAGAPACNLFDLTVDANPGEDAAVQGLLPGGSEDGAYVYLVANGVLGNGAEEGATPGDCRGEESEGTRTCNLYVLHNSSGTWTTRFIARLSSAENVDWSPSLLRGLAARVSPDGRYLAFMSRERLTGYDNADVNSGQPDEEVYLYHAATSPTGELEPGHLVCASCNPSGARPVGLEMTEEGDKIPLINEDLVWGSQWVAASVPGWVGVDQFRARRQPRYLSDSGRLFFDGVDALVPQASNNAADVYEYEPAGVGSCLTADATFGQASDGCVALVSGASSGEESVFLDASENGGDVFFLTSARLSPQDRDTAYDVYDAHVCSATVPCPALTVGLPPCTTGDSCKAAPSSQPAIFGAPASATFSGIGNVAPPSTSAVKPKPQCKKSFARNKHNKCVKARAKKKRGRAKKADNGRRAKS
jgi:WD40-like Beta Propeller Repeat